MVISEILLMLYLLDGRMCVCVCVRRGGGVVVCNDCKVKIR